VPEAPTDQELAVFRGSKAIGLEYPDAGVGHKFPLPNRTDWKVTDHLRRRYDPVVNQMTRMLMRDGKLSVAQKVALLSLSRTSC
jgi:hypothetical protein